MAQVAFTIKPWTDAVLDGQYSQDIIRDATNEAQAVMMLGEVEQANRIVDYLYGRKEFGPHNVHHRMMMHYAWAASDCWPAFTRRPQTEELEIAPMLCAPKQDWGPQVLPELHAQNRAYYLHDLGERPPEAPWAFDDLVTARQNASPGYPEHGVNAASIEIAYQLGMEDIAAGLARQKVKYLRGDRVGTWTSTLDPIARSYGLWQLFARGWLRKELDLSVSQIESHVDQVLDLTQRRLERGARQRYKDLSLNEMMVKFDDLCVRHQVLGVSYHGEPHYLEHDGGIPTTFLSAPATEIQIAQLERSSREHGFASGLPKDYKALLQISNGIAWQSRNMLYPVDCVKVTSDTWKLELLPEGAVQFHWDNWPVVGATLNIGECGDEGTTYLIRPAALHDAKVALEEIYDRASVAERRCIERAAKDIYGGVAELRAAEGLVLRYFHWSGSTEIFVGVRGLLEQAILGQERGEAEHGLPEDL